MSKHFSKVVRRDHRKVLVLFRVRGIFATGGRDVLRPTRRSIRQGELVVRPNQGVEALEFL
jgi:hypothetical protein